MIRRSAQAIARLSADDLTLYLTIGVFGLLPVALITGLVLAQMLRLWV